MDINPAKWKDKRLFLSFLLVSAASTQYLLVCHLLVYTFLGPSVRLFAKSFSWVSSGYHRNSTMQVRVSFCALARLLMKDMYVYRHCLQPRTCGHRGRETSYELVLPFGPVFTSRYRYAHWLVLSLNATKFDCNEVPVGNCADSPIMSMNIKRDAFELLLLNFDDVKTVWN